jgi:NAD+ dependent glucose-6-phosphate dehydrogenase
MSAMPENLKLLMTGAAGSIGTYYRNHVGDRYDLRLVDVHPVENPGPHESRILDLSDPEAARQACEGIHTVLHLAANPHTTAEFYHDLLDPNFKAVYNVYRAAKDQGCSRVIFASSINAVAGYPKEQQIRPEDAPCPLNVYGASKAFGESLGAYFAAVEGLSVIAVRIGWFGTLDFINGHDDNAKSIFVSHRDLAQLFDRCVETPGISFAVVHGTSNNRRLRMDLTATRQLLGYQPVDDAFS